MNQNDLFGPTLADARAMLFEKAPVGTVCPCCDKFCKVYHRKFNSGMALGLIYSYRYNQLHPAEFFDFRHHCMKRYDFFPGDYTKLIWWGMFEKHPTAQHEQAKSNGLYRITPRGIAFVECKTSIESHANEYMSGVTSFDGDTINIRQALGKQYNYAELMREVGAWRNDQ